jgi:RecA-family ATPase
VRVDAPNKAEYDKRVRWLYDYCDRHGFMTDKQNKNALRLSRLPGATRNGRRQLLLATNIGEPDWESWKRWAEESEDDLPDDSFGDWDEPIALKPMLIGLTEHDCILRQGAKMIVVGDSKMGKSYTLIDLAEAICVGGDWLGMQCAQGKVFYVNLEIDPAEFRWRQHKVWDERPESGDEASESLIRANFYRWDLRGYAANLRDIAPRLVRRVLRHGPAGTFKAIVIDPIYKVNGGDDNDAKAVAEFTNTIDLIIQACGCSVIYAHHHPKGATGGKKAIDRMSGSGVYGRDADTVIDFGELFVPDDIWKTFGRKPCYRAEIKCRSFGYRKPRDVYFMWPRFLPDTQDVLSSCKILGEDPSGEGRIKGSQVTKDKAKEAGWNRLLALNDAFDNYPNDDFSDAVEFSEDFVSSIRWGAFGINDSPALATIRGWVKGTSTAKFVPTIQEHFELMQARNKTYLRRLREPETDAD